MGSRRKTRADHQADTRGGRWLGIPHAVLNSAAYLHCDLWERAILIEIIRRLNGYNNGKIAIAQRELAQRLGKSNFHRIGRSIARLMEKGLIDIAAEGVWKPRLARQYRLTFVSSGCDGRIPASNEYLNWRPVKKSRAEDDSAADHNSAEHGSAAIEIGAESGSTRHNGKPPLVHRRAAEPGSSLIGSHTVARQKRTKTAIPATSNGAADLPALSASFRELPPSATQDQC